MKVESSISIAASPQVVWGLITDIEGAEARLRGVKGIKVLEPAKGPSIQGLKWEETREFAGRDATETMWVTEAEAPNFYRTRAESHGAIYQSEMRVEAEGKGARLIMGFEGNAVTTGAKILWLLTGWMAKGPLKKTMAEDLKDLKLAAESS